MRLLPFLLLPALAWAQPVVPMRADGTCEAGWYPYQDFCISAAALNERGMDAVARDIQELRRAGALAAPVGKPGQVAYLARVQGAQLGAVSLTNGAAVEIQDRPGLNVPTGAQTVLFPWEQGWRLWVEGRPLVRVNVLRAPLEGAAPGAIHRLHAAPGEGYAEIGGEDFRKEATCPDARVGDPVVFLSGDITGRCDTARVLNLRNGETCDLVCE